MSKKGLVETTGITFMWKKEGINSWTVEVPVRFLYGEGVYRIDLVKRPHYCDRGDWLIVLSTSGCHDIDGADGFPRYFCGSDKEAMTQVELWCMRRQEVKDAL